MARDLAMRLASLQTQGSIETDVLDSQVQSILEQALDQLARLAVGARPVDRLQRTVANCRPDNWPPALCRNMPGRNRAAMRAISKCWKRSMPTIDAKTRWAMPSTGIFNSKQPLRRYENGYGSWPTAMAETIRCRAAAGSHLVSVGSGPALEVARALERVSPELRRSVHVTLIDIDPEALASAAQRLRRLSSGRAVDLRARELVSSEQKGITTGFLGQGRSTLLHGPV